MTYPNVTLDTISEGSDSKEVIANNMAEAESPAALFGCRANTTTGLTFGYYGGVMFVDGVITAISTGTVLLTASQTNYVEATYAGVVSANTTSFTAGRIPLYTIATGTATISTVTPARAFVEPSFLTQQAAVTIDTADVTLTAAQARCRIIVLSGTLTGNRSLIVPNRGEWIVVNGTSGAYTVTVKTSAGTGETVGQTDAKLLIADGTNVVSATTDVANNTFSTIAVSGQSDVVADSSADTLTLAAGSGITITTNAGTDTVTITNSGSASNSFETIAVSGQSNVVADSGTDTLTFVAGTNVTITTDAATDSITINASGGGSSITLGTPQNSTSGTSIDFTSIPSGTKSITVMFDSVSTSGSDAIMIQLGDSGGVETTGYVTVGTIVQAGGSTAANSSSGFLIGSAAASDMNLCGEIKFHLQDSSTNTWTGYGGCCRTTTAVQIFNTAGRKPLSAELDRIRITTVNGSDTFDAGVINIQYE